MPSICGKKSQGGHKYRLKWSQEIANSLQTPHSSVQGNSTCLLLMKCFLLLRSSFVVMEGKGLTHSPVTQRTAASRTFGVSVAVTHPWSGVPRVAPAGYKHGRSQGTGTCYPGICRAPSTTEPGQATRGRHALASWLARLWLLSWSCSWSQHLEHKVKKPFLKLSWLMARANADGETVLSYQGSKGLSSCCQQKTPCRASCENSETLHLFLFSRWASATLGHWTPVPVHKHLFQVHPSQVHPKREPHPQRTSLQECWSHVSVLQNFPDYLTRRKQIFLSRGCQCSVSGVSSRQKQLLRKQNSNIPCSCRQCAACCKLCAVLPISTL